MEIGNAENLDLGLGEESSFGGGGGGGVEVSSGLLKIWKTIHE